MADYDPSQRSATNPVTCVTSWIGNLFRGRVPDYLPAPTEPITRVLSTAATAVARVRGVELYRTPIYLADGSIVEGDGPIATVTLIVDDDAIAAAVLSALHGGAHIRVASAGGCG